MLHDREAKRGYGAVVGRMERVMGPKADGTIKVNLLGSAHRPTLDQCDASVLETFANQHPDHDYWVTLTCPEFTSLCPVTGQPDFGTIVIRYVPSAHMVESKSLKFYLFGFRNRGDFHEDCVNLILKDLRALMAPKYIEVVGEFAPRGGIAITPFVNYGEPDTGYEALARQRFAAHGLE